MQHQLIPEPSTLRSIRKNSLLNSLLQGISEPILPTLPARIAYDKIRISDTPQ
jgi:hypothetical protein